MPRTTDARQKAIATAERLFRTQGYAATGLTQIIAESGSPKGSFYFHFPGGKRQLALEMLAAYRARTAAGFRALADRSRGDRDAFVVVLANGIADEMRQSGWSSGCAAQAVAQELAPDDAEVADALAGLFDEWIDIVADVVGSEDATALVASLEGARTLARAQRSAAAFDAIKARFTQSGTSANV